MPFISKRVIDKFCLSRKALNGGKDDAVKRVKLGRRSGYFDDFDVIGRIRRKSSMCGRRTGTLVCAASRAHTKLEVKESAIGDGVVEEHKIR